MKETTPSMPIGQLGRPPLTCEPNLIGSSPSIDAPNISNVTLPTNTLNDRNVGPIAG